MNLPSREQCDGWDQRQVALFMGKNNTEDCAAAVNRMKIWGQKLMTISDGDMSKFHRPQLQKIAQDIQKNDSSYLNKFRRLKSKPGPEVPVRDYRDEDMVGPEDASEPDYDNEMYDNPQEHDINYEPPPSQKVFTRTSSSSFLTGDYLDSCHNGPNLGHKKAFKRGKESRQLPPEPTQIDSHDADYISPDGNTEDDNYVEPEDNPTADAKMFHTNRTMKGHPVSQLTLPKCQPSSDFYEVPDQEAHVSAYRVQMMRSPCAEHQAESDSSYEVWDHDDKPAKHLPRESAKPPLRLAQAKKLRAFERRTLPMIDPDRKAHPPKALTLDMKRPKAPFPNATFLKQTDSKSLENGATDQDKDSEVYEKPWFAGECDRKTAEELLFHANQDGAFMVRKSSRQDTNQPYTLVVYYKGRVYNIPIRLIHMHTRQQYALGREKKGEEYFHSVSHIIENHQKNPLVLIDSKSNSKDSARLRFPVKQPTTSGHHCQASNAF
ncbi:B-cell linker protein isoform X1 [Hippocampus comes]|uniref:B-cell linker protein isoform X1 n=2 Tax=Hippocampus comes TaxID=109280 RepID=UPI00094E1760|nr:PREDICTED: B-cell linker protein-like isoform X1 [Hippocampus comes]